MLTARPDAAAWAGEIKVKGTATINGEKIVTARPAAASIALAGAAEQQRPSPLSRLDRSLMLAVRGKAPFTLTPTLDKAVVTPGRARR